MNYKMMNQLINDIKKSKTFDMACITNFDCGTPACLAGHLFLYATENEKKVLNGNGTPSGVAIDFMANKLGITFNEAHKLFWGRFGKNRFASSVYDIEREEITKDETIYELNQLIKKYKAQERHANKMIDKIINDTQKKTRQKQKELTMTN